MGQGHNHGDEGHGQAGHNHAAGANTKSLIIALSLTGVFLVAEVVGAWWFNSLALLSDAAHMMTDVIALAIALAAIRIGQKPADKQRTYGYRRFEILAASFNAVLLFLVAGYVMYEGIARFFAPEPVQSVGMFIVAAIGLVVNLISMRVLMGRKDESLNVKGAYLEVWADMLGSVGVIGAATAIYFTGWSWIDPVVAIAIGLWVLPRTWVLLRDTTHILLQGVPRGTDIDKIRASMAGVPGVIGVHDLHIWSMAGDDVSLTAHILVDESQKPYVVRAEVAKMLESSFGIHHSTLQAETEPCGDVDELHA